MSIIDAIEIDRGKPGDIDKRYTAWEKLRWLEALKNSSNKNIEQLRDAQLLRTDGKTPDFPDFSSYMSGGWVGPSSPKSKDELSKMKVDEIAAFLLDFKDTDEFRAPSVDGMARTLDEYVVDDPVKCAGLLAYIDRLNFRYLASLLDGYSKAWNKKLFVPTNEILTGVSALVKTERFTEALKDNESKADWALSSFSNFVESGTREDGNSFPLDSGEIIYTILARCIDICSADERYHDSSDAYTRAINEPRGRLFSALIIMSLWRARASKTDSKAFTLVWESLVKILEPILKKTDDTEVSLYALVGAYYRQICFLNEDWLYKNIDLIVPSPDQHGILWRSFMDGFCYVTNYIEKIYDELKSRDYLLRYLRYVESGKEASSRLNRLQNRIVELGIISYLLGHETNDQGVVGSILESKYPEEWNLLISSLLSIIGEKPEAEHLIKAKELISKLIDSGNQSRKEALRSLARFLELLKDPQDPLVEKIFQVVCDDKDVIWGFNGLIEYLHQFRDTHPGTVAKLFKEILRNTSYAPTWPKEQIREICQALVKNSETTSMIEICRIYAERSVSCEPIRDICMGLNLGK